MAYVIEASLTKDVVEQNLRERIAAFQKEVGMQDHGWVLGSEIAEIKSKIVKDKKGDWREAFGRAYNLSFDIFCWEKSR